MAGPEQDARWVEQVVAEFLEDSPLNDLGAQTREKAWDRALVGYVAGDDPIYQVFKDQAVGPFHWTPAEIFNLTFADRPAQPHELTVISWILPQREATKADNRRESTYPAERWARARIYGEKANAGLRQALVEALAAQGVDALAPQLSPLWARHISPRFGFASTWSERHSAHAAGLGTFGLCDGLITPLGKAVRVGSVVARLALPPSPRPYDHHRAWCLYFAKGKCQACAARCPVGAITDAGKDKEKCLAHLKPASADYVKQNFGFDGYGCGLCQTKVPCESGIPAGLAEDAKPRA